MPFAEVCRTSGVSHSRAHRLPAKESRAPDEELVRVEGGIDGGTDRLLRFLNGNLVEEDAEVLEDMSPLEREAALASSDKPGGSWQRVTLESTSNGPIRLSG